MTITFFDVLILFALLGGAAMGFFRGFVRQAAATLIIYISVVVASIGYSGVSRTLSRMTGQPVQAPLSRTRLGWAVRDGPTARLAAQPDLHSRSHEHDLLPEDNSPRRDPDRVCPGRKHRSRL